MSKPTFTLLSLLLMTLSFTASADYVPPTDDELDEILANPNLIKAVEIEASGEEAAEVLLRIIDKVQKSKLGPLQKRYLVAYWTARIVELLKGSELEPFADAITELVDGTLLEIIYSGMSIGGAGNNSFIDYIQGLAGDVDAFQNAILRPETVLTIPVYNLLLTTIQSGQTLPPPPNITTPIIPPGVVEQNQIPPQPPVPPPYNGQG